MAAVHLQELAERYTRPVTLWGTSCLIVSHVWSPFSAQPAGAGIFEDKSANPQEDPGKRKTDAILRNLPFRCILEDKTKKCHENKGCFSPDKHEFLQR